MPGRRSHKPQDIPKQHSAVIQGDIVKDNRISDEEMIKIVVQVEMKKKASEDEDTVKRKRNIIIYRATKKKVEDVVASRANDKAFVTDLLDGVFDMKIDDFDIEKMYRLGRWEEGKVRPLLVTFKNLEQKEIVMANLRKLKERGDRFQMVGIAHDLSPKERQDIKDMVDEAKREHAANSTDEMENYHFLPFSGGREGVEAKSFKDKKNQLNCLCLNARSIVNKIDLFWATVYDLQPDIVGVTESWTTGNILDSRVISGGLSDVSQRPSYR